MRNRLPLRIALAFAGLVVAFLLLIQPRMPTTLAQVGADKRPTPTPAPKAQPKRTITRSTSRSTPRSTPEPSSQPKEKTASVPRAGTVVRNQIGMELVYVPAGSFTMGASDAEVQAAYENYKKYSKVAAAEWFINEKPQHRVTINQPFYMGKYEVTIGEWKAVMGDLPEGMKTNLADRFKESDRQPVEQVSWDDAQVFIAKLNAMNDRYTYRLPSEAEWEYACRAGTTGEYAGKIDAMAWYANNSGKTGLDALAILSADAGDYVKRNYRKRLEENENRPHEVGGKQPNGFGLYDMYGNVWEWCEDIGHENYNGAPLNGSAWTSGGEQKYRVLRGGSYYEFAGFFSSAFRQWEEFTDHNRSIGFRVVAMSRSS